MVGRSVGWSAVSASIGGEGDLGNCSQRATRERVQAASHEKQRIRSFRVKREGIGNVAFDQTQKPREGRDKKKS